MIRLEKPKEPVKAHGNANLRAREAQENQMGQGRPKKKKTNGTQEPASDEIKEPMAVLGHWEKNKR